jgi:arylsulfatase
MRRSALALLILLGPAAVLVFGLLLEIRKTPREAPGTPATPAIAEIPAGGNVLVIVCDTLRADHLGLYGYPRPTSPFIDSLARRAWVYENAYSHFSYTWPTVSNLFTGRPYSRLVQDKLFVSPAADMSQGGLLPVPTLAGRLRQAGVATAAVVANPYVNSRVGFAQGFDSFHDVYAWDPDFWKTLHKYTAEEVNTAAIAAIAGIDGLERTGKPWFLYLHYFDPHMPYVAPAEDRAVFADPSYARTGRLVDGYLYDPQGKLLKYLTDDQKGWVDPSDIAHLVAQYDAEIRHFDRGLRQLFEQLEGRGLLEDTTVILTADHGEAFFERGFWGHGFLSRAEEERVPLVVIPPARMNARPARIEGVATTTDVHYSVLRHFGVAPAPEATPWWAVDLLSGRRFRNVAYTEGAWDAVVLRSRRHSYYQYRGLVPSPIPLPVRNGEFLFDRAADPGEARDLFAADPKLGAAVRERLLAGLGIDRKRLPGTWGEPLHEMDEESKKKLRALGYL